MRAGQFDPNQSAASEETLLNSPILLIDNSVADSFSKIEGGVSSERTAFLYRRVDRRKRACDLLSAGRLSISTKAVELQPNQSRTLAPAGLPV
jgi:hypothetical protein